MVGIPLLKCSISTYSKYELVRTHRLAYGVTLGGTLAGRPGCTGPGAPRALWLRTPDVKASFCVSEGSCVLRRAPSCPHPELQTPSAWEAAGAWHPGWSLVYLLSCSPCRSGRECPLPVAKMRSTPASKSGDGTISYRFSKFRPRRQGLLRIIKRRKKVPGRKYLWSFHSPKV